MGLGSAAVLALATLCVRGSTLATMPADPFNFSSHLPGPRLYWSSHIPPVAFPGRGGRLLFLRIAFLLGVCHGTGVKVRGQLVSSFHHVGSGELQAIRTGSRLLYPLSYLTSSEVGGWLAGWLL